MKEQPIPMKTLISSKQPSLIFSIRKIEKSKLAKKDASHTQVRSADLLLSFTIIFITSKSYESTS